MSKNKLASSNISININKLAQIVVKELKKDNYIFMSGLLKERN